MFLEHGHRLLPIAVVEQGRRQELGLLSQGRGVAPTQAEARLRSSADQRIRAGSQEGVSNEADVAFRRRRSIEQARAAPERHEREPERLQLRRHIDPGVISRRRLLASRNERLARLHHVDPHDLDPPHHSAIAFDWSRDLDLEHGQSRSEVRWPRKLEQPISPAFRILVCSVRDRSAALASAKRKRMRGLLEHGLTPRARRSRLPPLQRPWRCASLPSGTR